MDEPWCRASLLAMVADEIRSKSAPRLCPDAFVYHIVVVVFCVFAESLLNSEGKA